MWGSKIVNLSKRTLIIAIGILFLVSAHFSFAQKILKPLSLRSIPRESTVKSDEFRSGVSEKNLLGLERPSLYALPTAKHGMPLTAASIMSDSIRVLVLKVEFQKEIPDDPYTTGDGTFDLRTYDQFVAAEGHYIDPAPHNTSYFNAHMQALHNYWYYVSEKQLQIQWDVYPQPESVSIQLPVPMAYYGSNMNWESIGDRLGNFLIRAITLADSLYPEIDFGRYQAVIVFHAGSDQQNNLSYFPQFDTPYDFYTGFLKLSKPVMVDDSTVAIQEGTILPEFASQDNRITALNGVVAHEFGHQLGLVDLYKTDNFFTQVGDFSLMDNNGMSVGVQFPDIGPTVGGTMPVYPDAWSRAYLGFDIPREITDGNNVPISAAAQNHGSTEIIKVPITEYEYFLIENRQQDADTLDPSNPFADILVGDPATGVILGPGFAYFQGNDTILVSDGEYDRITPGNGAVIWHVDEAVAYQDTLHNGDNNFFNNTLQWDPARRFLSLVEADGVIDFGGYYYRGYGDDNDYFKGPNRVSFTPSTNPSSNSILGCDSHISVTDISNSDTLMYVDINIDWLMAGWPQMGLPNQMSDPIIADLLSNDTSEVLITASNRLLIWKPNGQKFISNGDSVGILRYDSSIAIYPWAIAAECDSTISTRPVIFDYNGDGENDIALTSNSGRLYAFNPRDNNSDGRLDPIVGFPLDLHLNTRLAPITVNFLPGAENELIAFDDSGKVHMVYNVLEDSVVYNFNGIVISAAAYQVAGKNVIDALVSQPGGTSLNRIAADSGTAVFAQEFSPVAFPFYHYVPSIPVSIIAVDIDRDGNLPEILITFSYKIELIKNDGSVAWSIDTDRELYHTAIGDINSDGYPEIVIGAESAIYAFNYTGSLMQNFPIDMNKYKLGGAIISSPILGDIDNNAAPEIIVGLPGGGIYAFDQYSDRVAGFPLPSSFGVSNSAALGDLNNDGEIDLVTEENSGFVKAWNLSAPYEFANVPWGMAGGNIFNNSYLSTVYQKNIAATDQQLPVNSVFNYPNPATNSTTIRFYLNSNSNVKIEMFDLMGDRIHDATIAGQAHADNEYVWNCQNVASGVYYCRVEAANNTGKTSRMIKIAIAK